jgi:DNA replication factor GINS
MADTVLEGLKRALDSEVDSDALAQLPADFYSSISAYTQKIRRAAGSSASEAANRLIAKQARMIESMTRQLLGVRAQKAARKHALLQLLPEERYVCSAQQRFDKRFDAFVEAVSAGRPSFVEFAHKSEAERSITVRVSKHVDELVGLDLRRYGPFEPEDVASLPATDAEVLIAAGDAVEIYTRDEA